MSKKFVLIMFLSVVVLTAAVRNAEATTITSANIDEDVYVAGQTGYISVTVYNDEDYRIRITEITATIDYYYADGTVYVQKFFTNAVLPEEIAAGDSQTYEIPISLPINIADGYTNPFIESRNEIWVPLIDRWIGSERATYDQMKLYIESPYEQMYQTSQQELQSTQQQLQEEKAVNENLSNSVNMLALTTMVFAIATGLLLFMTFARKPKPVAQA